MNVNLANSLSHSPGDPNFYPRASEQSAFMPLADPLTGDDLRSSSSDPLPPSSGGSSEDPAQADSSFLDVQGLTGILVQEFQMELKSLSRSARAIALRIAQEVVRICTKSDRIQASGEIRTWQLALARHRVKKCLSYYHLGSERGRVDLHSNLSAMVYRHVAPLRAQLGFQARYNLIEDFLQGFYIEVLKAFRRENQLPDYTPRTQLELAEYMAFAEQYAKRRIGLPGRNRQQLIVLRAQGFARRQPPEASLDIESAMEAPRNDAEVTSQSSVAQEIREQMVTEAADPAEQVLRERVIGELVAYLESQGQSDCIDYLTLKLHDLSAPEIDEILGLSSRQRDYLQQRFKYHVEKFARTHQWKLVHQWLGADVDQNLGLSPQLWERFLATLSADQRLLVQLKQAQWGEAEIAQALKCTVKQMRRRWSQVLDLAWQARNQSEGEGR